MGDSSLEIPLRSEDLESLSQKKTPKEHLQEMPNLDSFHYKTSLIDLGPHTHSIKKAPNPLERLQRTESIPSSRKFLKLPPAVLEVKM